MKNSGGSMSVQKGFTLIELMIVVAIVAILAAISIPAYNDYITRSKLAEATSTLSSLRTNMEQYYQDNRTYLTPAGDCGIGATPAANTKYFTISCGGALPHPSAPAATTYIIAATGIGSMAGFTFTINQANAKATFAAPVAKGWTLPNPNSCWVSKKGGLC